MTLGPKAWSRTRARISELLRHDHPELRDNRELRERALVAMADVKLHLPIAVAGFTDFYSSKEHATNVGTMSAINPIRCCRTGCISRLVITDARPPSWSAAPGCGGRAAS